MHYLFQTFRPTVTFLLAFTVILGGIYPAVVTSISQLAFPLQANGSLIVNNGKVVGSTLIGQQFNKPEYFWGRLSATGPVPYNAAASTGSNLGNSNPALLDAVKTRIAALKKADPENIRPIPVDLVTASGSGLDPHISIGAAQYQLGRVARARGLSGEIVQNLIKKHTENRLFGLLGEPTVNVLMLNLELDGSQGPESGVR